MKQRQWSVRRCTVPQADAQVRWDRSYQDLVQWSAAVLSEHLTEPFSQLDFVHFGGKNQA